MRILKWRKDWHAQRLNSEGGYRLIEDFSSPYSAKVRSYLRYKGVAYQKVQVTYDLYAKTIPSWVGFPIIPVLLTPDNRVMQDSTPIIQWFEKEIPEPYCEPNDPAVNFLNWLIEDFADEYMVRIIMHYRWGNELNRTTLSHRLARTFAYLGTRNEIATGQQNTLKRQTGIDRLLSFGSDIARQDVEEQTVALLRALENHLGEYLFLCGDRPAPADFALYGMLWAHLFNDPYSARLMEEQAPVTCGYLDMLTNFGDPAAGLAPRDLGEFASSTDQKLLTSLQPILKLISETYMPWMLANAQAVHDGVKKVKVSIGQSELSFPAAHYKATTWEAVLSRYKNLDEASQTALGPVLQESGLLKTFEEAPVLHCDIFDGLTPPFVENGYADLRTKKKVELRKRK